MAKNIEPELVTIGKYLKLDYDAQFIIPEYQRKYAWEISNCDKLWSDIFDFMESNSKDPYFFGTIIINCSNDDTELSLIDGQQRVTKDSKPRLFDRQIDFRSSEKGRGSGCCCITAYYRPGDRIAGESQDSPRPYRGVLQNRPAGPL